MSLNSALEYYSIDLPIAAHSIQNNLVDSSFIKKVDVSTVADTVIRYFFNVDRGDFHASCVNASVQLVSENSLLVYAGHRYNTEADTVQRMNVPFINVLMLVVLKEINKGGNFIGVHNQKINFSRSGLSLSLQS